MLLQPLCVAVDDGKGGFQLVGDVGGHLAAVLLRCLGIFQRSGQAVDLIYTDMPPVLFGVKGLCQSFRLSPQRRDMVRPVDLLPLISHGLHDLSHRLYQTLFDLTPDDQQQYQRQCEGNEIYIAQLPEGRAPRRTIDDADRIEAKLRGLLFIGFLPIKIGRVVGLPIEIRAVIYTGDQQIHPLIPGQIL